MKHYLIIAAICFVSQLGFGQKDTVSVNGVKFLTIRQTIKNDFGTKDTLLKLYRLDTPVPKYVLKHYLCRFGGDAENEFKDIGTIQIYGDSIILKTHYLQHGFDPIPEWRKRIYKVTGSGKLVLLFDKCKQKNSAVWTKTEFPEN